MSLCKRSGRNFDKIWSIFFTWQKKLQGDNNEIVVIDATEMPIQRQKKTKKKNSRGNKKDIL